MNRRGFRFESVLKAASVSEIKKLSPYAIELARRWVKDWPEKARQLEAAGKLIPALKQHAEEESLQQWRSRVRSLARATGGPARRQERDSGQPAR
jgi:hypothetical protein